MGLPDNARENNTQIQGFQLIMIFLVRLAGSHRVSPIFRHTQWVARLLAVGTFNPFQSICKA